MRGESLMSVTIEEIARAAGVSTATVSRALHGTYPVKESTKQRIHRLAIEMNYRPNIIARSLRTEQTSTIGIIVDDIASPFTPRIIRGINDYLQEHNYFSVILNADRRLESETSALHNLLSRSIDGVILVESFLRGANPTLDLAGKPYVFVHRLFSGGGGNSVMVDELYGSQLAINHLLELGHKRIAHIAGPAGWDAAEARLAGYKEALDRGGVTYDPALVRWGNWLSDGGYTKASELLMLEEPPTAIFAANDQLALGAIYAARDMGLKVPDDLAVIGYDNQQIAEIARPDISTVTLPCYEMGIAAARILLDCLSGFPLPDAPIKVRGELVPRGSTYASIS